MTKPSDWRPGAVLPARARTRRFLVFLLNGGQWLLGLGCSKKLLNYICYHPVGLSQSIVGVASVLVLVRLIQAASSPNVLYMQWCVGMIGGLIVLARTRRLMDGSSTVTLSVLFGFLLRCVLTLELLIYGLGKWGSTIYALAERHPRVALDIGVAFFLVSAVKGWLSPPPESGSHLTGFGLLIPRWRAERVRVRRELYTTAVHEAGHALVYAVLSDAPVAYEIRINERPSKCGLLGYVNMEHPAVTGHDVETLEWQMLGSLAGSVAEEQYTQRPACGAEEDFRDWQKCARLYLGSQTRGVFYLEDFTSLEQIHNHNQLDVMLHEQREMLRTFCKLNSDLLTELARAVFVERCMSYEQALPYLQRVQIPPGFPRPLNLRAPG